MVEYLFNFTSNHNTTGADKNKGYVEYLFNFTSNHNNRNTSRE